MIPSVATGDNTGSRADVAGNAGCCGWFPGVAVRRCFISRHIGRRTRSHRIGIATNDFARSVVHRMLSRVTGTDKARPIVTVAVDMNCLARRTASAALGICVNTALLGTVHDCTLRRLTG